MSFRGKISVKEVRRLSQVEGYIDKEIADALGCHRVTVTRLRDIHNIPRPKLSNRKDKKQVCNQCGKEEVIRRRERVRKYCFDCQNDKIALRRHKNKLYMRNRQK